MDHMFPPSRHGLQGNAIRLLQHIFCLRLNQEPFCQAISGPSLCGQPSQVLAGLSETVHNPFPRLQVQNTDFLHLGIMPQRISSLQPKEGVQFLTRRSLRRDEGAVAFLEERVFLLHGLLQGPPDFGIGHGPALRLESEVP